MRIQDELSQTLKEQIILDTEVKCKLLNRTDITCPSLSEWVNVSCSVMSSSLEKWTVAHQASLSMEFSREQCWSGLPFPSPGDLLNSRVEFGSPALQVDSLQSEPPGKPPGKPPAWALHIPSESSHCVMH